MTDDIDTLKAEVSRLTNQLDETVRVIGFVNGWLGVLPDRTDLTGSMVEDVEFLYFATQRLLADLIAAKC